jgi:hypothetical protein
MQLMVSECCKLRFRWGFGGWFHFVESRDLSPIRRASMMRKARFMRNAGACWQCATMHRIRFMFGEVALTKTSLIHSVSRVAPVLEDDGWKAVLSNLPALGIPNIPTLLLSKNQIEAAMKRA